MSFSEQSQSNSLGQWFLDSQIHRGRGAYAMYYEKNGIGPIYPEITSYAISLSCVLFKELDDNKYLRRAKESAQFMLANYHPAVAGPKGQNLYTFDTGILICGLLDLYLTNYDGSYLREAQKRIDWLLSLFDGRRFPSVMGSSNDSHGQAWHRTSSVHLAKLSIPLLKGWKVIGNETYKEVACKLLDWAMKLQLPEGRFSINEMNNATMLHPHCYATEGFLYAAKILDSRKYLDVAKNASRWLKSVQNANGSFYKWLPYMPGSPAKRLVHAMFKTTVTDATAQAIRIWKLLGKNSEGVYRAQDYLNKMQLDGGLRLYTRKVKFMEIRGRRIYSWPSFFYIHSCSIGYGEFEKIDEIF